jgi:hypothetical protein
MMTFMQRGALVLVAVMLLLGQKSAFAQTLACSSSCTPGPTDTCVDVSGVVTYEASTVSALVLINGVSQFSKESDGKYGCKVLVKSDGVITVKAFAGGFAPYTQEITQSQADGFAINILALNTLDAVMNVTVNVQPSDGNPGAYDLSGNVKSFGQPVNAYMIGSGVESFSTPASGDFTLQGLFPNSDGQIELFAFADGHQSYSRFITLGCAAENTCEFIVQISNTADKIPNFSPTKEYSYTWGFADAPAQLSKEAISTKWTAASGKIFNYLQTANFSDYNPLTARPPTAIVVQDTTSKSTEMTLQYGNQTLSGTLINGSFHFDLVGGLILTAAEPYHFTIHPYDGVENRELAVWLGSTYVAGTPTTVSSLFKAGHRNHWISGTDPASGTEYLAYVGGLYDYAKDNSGGFNLNLDMELDGQAMNLSTNYALFKWVSGDPPATCLTSFNCQVEFKGQFTLPVTGPITIAGSGRISGYSLLGERFEKNRGPAISATVELSEVAKNVQFRVQSGLIELSASAVGAPFAIDIAGITVASSPYRQDSSVLLNNSFLPMASLSDALAGKANEGANNHPVKAFDFKMVGNWIDGADGLDVHGDGSLLQYTYLHIADDSLKVSAQNIRYEQTTVLQGDVNTGGMVNLGSYGTARDGTQGSRLADIHVHRITQKPATCSGTAQGNTGTCGAALVAAPTCEFGNDVADVKVDSLRVNNLGDDSSSVNRAFNIGLGPTFGDSCKLSDGKTTATTKTNITDLTFTNFGIYLDPRAYSNFFRRSGGGGGVIGGTGVDAIRFWDGTEPKNSLNGKVAIHSDSKNTDFAYFMCGVGTGFDEAGCWNTDGQNGGNGTANNVIYSGGGTFGVDYPYGP